MHDKIVPTWLDETSYEKLFVQREAVQILSRSGIHAELARIISASDVEPKLRVLAHELLLEAGQPVHSEIAEAYCRAMPSAFLHNWWGMPGQYLERLGRTMTALGQAAIPCLTHLLANQQPLGYFGSEEPTLSRLMQYRVSDLAAYIIATVINAAYLDGREVSERDVFIAELRRKLTK